MNNKELNETKNTIIEMLAGMSTELYNLDMHTSIKYAEKYVNEGHVDLNGELVRHGNIGPYAINLGELYNLNNRVQSE